MDPLVARLERIPLSRPHFRLLFQGGLGYTYDAASSGVVAFLMPVLATLWALSSSETGLLGSSTYIGYLFGALTAGHIGDRYGRKVVMMVALGLYCLATLIAAFSVNWWEFFALHVVAGYGTGAESAIIAPFLSEFVPTRQRGRYVGMVSGFFSFGFTFSLLIYIMMVPGYFTAAFLNDRLDRKWVIAVYLTGGGLSALGLAFAGGNGAILGAGMALSFFLNGVYAGLYSYTPELFLTRIRATGMATVSAIARIGAILSPIIIGDAYSGLGFGGVFAMMLMVLVVGVLVIIAFGVPTAGRSLEELTEETAAPAARVQPGVG